MSITNLLLATADEREALLMKNQDNFKLFGNLPLRSRDGTPLDEYSTGSTIVYDHYGTQRLYAIHKAKDTTKLDDLEWDEPTGFANQHSLSAPIGSIDYINKTDNTGLRIEAEAHR